MNFRELKDKLSWLQKDFNARFSIIAGEIKSMEAAEQTRVKEQERDFIRHGGPAPSHLCNPAPVVERFVMWNDDPDPGILPDGSRLEVRRKVGDVVAEDLHEIPTRRWKVTLPDGKNLWMYDDEYQTLKRNGCFGEQVKP